MMWKVATFYSFKNASRGVKSKWWQRMMEPCFPEQLWLRSSHVIRKLVWDYLIQSVTARRLYPGNGVCLTCLAFPRNGSVIEHDESHDQWTALQHHSGFMSNRLAPRTALPTPPLPLLYLLFSFFSFPTPFLCLHRLLFSPIPASILLSSPYLLSPNFFYIFLSLSEKTLYFVHHQGLRNETVTWNTSGWMLELNRAKNLTGILLIWNHML
jgi:hypothetical protein